MNVALHVFRAGLVAALAFVLPHPSLSQDRIEILHFQSLTFPDRLLTPFMPPARQGTPAAVLGILRMPSGSDRAPAVVLAHGCSGISGAEHYWGQRLAQLGIVTLVVNSFSGRGIPGVCTGTHSINVASVITDAYRALNLLAEHPRVDGSRIALMGFSFGGRTALWASHPRFQENYALGSLRFAAHLAFYPAGCYIRLADEDRISNVPIRIFHGTSDDWTPVGPCREYAARLRRLGKDVELVEYAGAHHGFDNDALPPHQTISGAMNASKCTFMERDGKIVDAATGDLAGLDSPCILRGASIGYSPDAQQQATADVEKVLRGVFRLK